MFSTLQKRNTVVTWRHFDRKSYSAFRSLGREIRIGVLAISTLTAAHTDALATRIDSLRIVKDTVCSSDYSLGEATVTGSQLSMVNGQRTMNVVVITRQDIDNAKCQTINDILKLCPNVDVRQRGAFGVQTDISLGGGTFDQVTFLLNGINIDNPQTGHLSADFPVAIADIERIELLDGASARIFGSQALNGIINIITRIAPHNSVGLHTEAGSYGAFGVGASVNNTAAHLRNRLSSNYFRTDGAVVNSAFYRQRLFYQGRYSADKLNLSLQAGYNRQRYGANTFYSALYPNQWEEDTRYMAALKADIGGGAFHIRPTLSFTRNYDHFQLIRSTATGENYHRTDVLSLALVGSFEVKSQESRVRKLFAYGAELRHEGILSTNLGCPMDKPHGRYDHHDSRNNLSVFVEHALTSHHWSLNVGVMGNRNTAVDNRLRFYPGIDISYQLSNLKLHLSRNKSMRMPTFTDLYYKSPTQQGNRGLKPEQATTYKFGGEYFFRSSKVREFESSRVNGQWSISVDGIYRRGREMIDWVMYSPDDIYHSTAFRLSNYQIKTTATYRVRECESSKVREFQLSYLFNHQHRHDATPIYQSCYALDYVRHKVVASLDHDVWQANNLSATWYFRWQHREGTHLEYVDGAAFQRANHPYALLDLKLRWENRVRRSRLGGRDEGECSVYISLENLLNHRYYDIGTVPQPGFTLLIGMEVKL